ncbi:TIGR03667 family PPOX class F420-dependent oxidoreductase [Gordonia sp. NPDC003425]
MTRLNIPDRVAQRLDHEQVIWLTTVDVHRAPIATPVWFLWHDDRFVIFSQPAKAKLRNISSQPTVSMHFNSSPGGGDVAVFVGDGLVDEVGPAQEEVSAYLAKYADAIPGIGLTPDGFLESYSVLVRVTPRRLRSW